MDKDKLVVEYIQLCLEFVSLAGPDPIDQEERNHIINRIKQIRELLGMEPINLE
ncbi:hypothetical protein [Lacrimispora saccharolytica]|uniref:Uncharacterized protein n=1 Tax=Lacrimispora saccharolytica (strain ATCC 35040 / DSM 2544 / NRCC 2533 / WM1) TaxID=610130 RepID=D9R5C7_LACSW|nr:hypothetical protein [Lacrimispora saccharolytica]ADL03333.1 hypothetical protein Closa_0707 [[Clostridium] saccharolyticum WM1]QRV18507.1 hypothetical protein I6K70_13235 [Lacrimispora saccharolytica]